MPSYIVPTCSAGGTLEAQLNGNSRYTCPTANASWATITVDEQGEVQEIAWQDVVTYTSAVVLIWAVGVGIGILLNILKRGADRY